MRGPHCPQWVRALGRPFSPSTHPGPRRSCPRWGCERPPHSHHLLPPPQPRHPAPVNLQIGGGGQQHWLPPCPPITSGARQRGCPGSPQHQLPQPGHKCHRQTESGLPAPKEPYLQPPRRTPPRQAGSGRLRRSQGTLCQDCRLVLKPPKPCYTLITLEVTGLRGGLKRNRLLFTDTIWTQAISSPFPAWSRASVNRRGQHDPPQDPARSMPSPGARMVSAIHPQFALSKRGITACTANKPTVPAGEQSQGKPAWSHGGRVLPAWPPGRGTRPWGRWGLRQERRTG